MKSPAPVNRPDLLQALDAVLPGLAPNVSVEQADCFCFKKGYVYTFDGDILCKTKTTLPEDFEAAVHGRQLREALQKMQTDAIEVSMEKDRFVVRGKRDTLRVLAESEFQLPVAAVDFPKVWKQLPTEFPEAIGIAVESAAADKKEFLITCVFLCSKYLQAMDNYTFSRHRMEIPLSRASLIRANAAKHLAPRSPSKMCETEGWLHFKNGTGLRMSIRRFFPEEHRGELLEVFDDIEEHRGKVIRFPKSIVPAAKIAEIFSKEYDDNNYVTVKMEAGRITVSGEGVSGHFSHRAKLRYSGEPREFTIGPKTLASIIEKHSDIELATGSMIVAQGNWYFCSTTKEAEEETGKNG